MHRSRDIGRNRAELGVRHETARPQYLAQPADDGHAVRSRHGAVEIDFALLNGLGQVFRTHQVSSRFTGGFGRLIAGEHRDPDGLARARRQHHRPAHLLVRLTGVEIEVQRDFNGLIELRAAVLLEVRKGVPKRKRPGAVEPLAGSP